MPDMRFNCNKSWASSTGTHVPLTTGRTFSSSSWSSSSLRNETLAANAPARLRKDNMPDMRYKDNRDYVKKTGMQVERTTKKMTPEHSVETISLSQLLSSSRPPACAMIQPAAYGACRFDLLHQLLSPGPAESVTAERESPEREEVLLRNTSQMDRVIAELKKEKLKNKAEQARSTDKLNQVDSWSGTSSRPQRSSGWEEEDARRKVHQENSKELCTSLQNLQLDDVEELSGEVLRTITSDFKNRIAQGGFSDVYKGIWRKQEVAVKVLRLGDREDLQRSLKYLSREVNTLAQLNHPHIVKLLAVCKSSSPEKPSPALIFTYANRGTLFEAIYTKDNTITVETIIGISLNIASALEYLHSCRLDGKVIVHRDVKCANVLLNVYGMDSSMYALLADLGISRFTHALVEENEVQSSVTGVVGTKGYIDPVYAETNRVDPSMDIYAYGVVLLEMLWRERPDNPVSPLARNAKMMSLEQCVQKAVAKNPSKSTETLEMIRGLLSIAKLCIRTDDVKERPTARDIVRKLQSLE